MMNSLDFRPATQSSLVNRPTCACTSQTLTLRQKGIGSECVKRTVDVYFDRLKLKRLFCEPHAFNTAPNRALQKAGFKYLKTYMTVPHRFNYRQAVNRWVIER